MAKKTSLSYQDIERGLMVFKTDGVAAREVGYALLSAFGKTDADIRRYREGKGVVSSFSEKTCDEAAGNGGLLIKGLFCYQKAESYQLTAALERLKQDDRVLRAAPKIIAVSDGETLLAYDTRERESYENPLARMYADFIFFYPLAGVEKVRLVEESPVDVKAAERLAKLHDELRAYNDFSSDQDLHDLNIFIARLLFCFFAEDTGIFEDNLFTDSVRRYTTDDADDVTAYIANAFDTMNRSVSGMEVNSLFKQFPYVNGGLFAHSAGIPHLSRKARRIIIECGELDWADINPDIFGSMIQAVVNPDVRANQGMHYTSVPNIRKVIDPLFLDELHEQHSKTAEAVRRLRERLELGEISRTKYYELCRPMVKQCDSLLLRMSRMKFFDPACGSGNFLIITYKALRLLEMDILRLKRQCTAAQTLDFIDGSVIRINQFYGIELLDFPHEVAMLSLWLAEHQMNRRFHREFGVNTQALPLKTITQIRCANACRVDWNEVCPHEKDEEVFVFGNPPYLGYVLQDDSQKADVLRTFSGYDNCKKLDYISCWFYLATQYIKDTIAKAAFVSTNSICQGEQVLLLWPILFGDGIRITYAHQSFKWTNNAKHNAGVSCVIIGMSSSKGECKLFSNNNVTICNYINPYLLPVESHFIDKLSSSFVGLPSMQKGSQPTDDGNLILDSIEKDQLISQYPEAETFIKKYIGAEELINGKERFCLWITEENKMGAYSIPFISKRIENVRLFRQNSKKTATKEWAEKPYSFTECRYEDSPCICVPSVSSEQRDYIPIGYLGSNVVVSNAVFAIYDAEVWLFGLLTSKMHMAWVRTVSGKLETRYRYSAQLCYNTFPFPRITAEKKAEIEDAANEVLDARDNHPGLTLAELYDPDSMPADLRTAHNRLDDIIDSCYPGYPFPNDEARLETLFRMYEKMVK